MSQSPLTINVAEAARRTGFSQHAIRRGIRDKTIPCIRIGRIMRIPTAWLSQLGA